MCGVEFCLMYISRTKVSKYMFCKKISNVVILISANFAKTRLTSYPFTTAAAFCKLSLSL